MKGKIVVFLLVLLVAFGYRCFLNLQTTFELTKNIERYDDTSNCKTFKGIKGAEDVLHWKKGIVFTSNLDALELWKKTYPEWQEGKVSNPHKAQKGAIYVIRNLSSSSSSSSSSSDLDDIYVEKLKMNNFPLISFHPHGFGLYRQKDELYVVNHAYDDGGERVDVFHIIDHLSDEIHHPIDNNNNNNNSDIKESKEIELNYIRSIVFGDDKMGILNDVIGVSEDEFYVTKYLPFPDTKYGRGTDFIYAIKELIYLTQPVPLSWTSIYYCNFKLATKMKGGNEYGEDGCKEVAFPAFMWNGITAEYSFDQSNNSYTYHSVIAYDFMSGIHVFNRSSNGDLTLYSKFSIPNYADNIEYDPSSSSVSYGGMLKLGLCYGEWYNAMAKSIDGKTQINCPIHSAKLNIKNGERKDLIIHDGSLLGGAASSVVVGDKVVIGSFADDGFLICPL